MTLDLSPYKAERVTEDGETYWMVTQDGDPVAQPERDTRRSAEAMARTMNRDSLRDRLIDAICERAAAAGVDRLVEAAERLGIALVR